MLTRSRKRRLESAEQSPVPAVEVIAGSEDLVREILLRLPVKSLLRFESVSRKWLSLISDPHFAQSYNCRRNPGSKPSGLFLNREYAFQFVPFNDNGDYSTVSFSSLNGRRFEILQSCNGLLLCSSTSFRSSKAKNRDFQYNICNPTTKQFTTLRFPDPEFGTSLISVNLAFDLLKSPHYKLICIRKVNSDSRTHQIDVYSWETRSLRSPASGSGDPLTFTAPPPGIRFRRHVYCNGAIHWFSEGKTSLYFDTHTEHLKTMPMPPCHEGFDFDINFRYFGESRGHLHLIVTDQPSAIEFDILELKADYSGWFIRYHVNLDAVVPTMTWVFDRLPWVFKKIFKALSVLCVNRAAKEEESILVLFVSRKTFSFNLNDKTSKKLCVLQPCHKTALDHEWSDDAYQYIETFFHI